MHYMWISGGGDVDKKKDKFTFSGMMTIEAALIIPMVWLIIAGIIYITFYLHDMTMSRSLIGRSLDKEELQGKLNQGLFIGTVKQVEIKEYKASKKKKVILEFQIPYFDIQKQETIQEEVSAMNFLEEIRSKKILEDKNEKKKE